MNDGYKYKVGTIENGYYYKNGKVIVSEYNADNASVRKETEREYQDNIEKILITENIIEYFNHLKKEVYEKLERKNNLKYGLKLAVIIKAIPPIFINDIIIYLKNIA